MTACTTTTGDGGPAAPPSATASDRSLATTSATKDGTSALVIVLDASGTMKTAEAQSNRIQAAKQAVGELLAAVPDGTPAALQVFGTQTGNSPQERQTGCQDVKLLAEPKPLDAAQRDRLREAVSPVEPRGYTPIGLALREADRLLPQGGHVIVITDGEDTCAPPPPCDVAKELKANRPGLTVSTVGFKVPGEATQQLACIAGATGGLFVTADDAKQLTQRLVAARTPEAAQQVLTTTGLGKAQLGMTYAELAAALAGFPGWQAATSSPQYAFTQRVTVIRWQDCDYIFDEGKTLIGISTAQGTIDGLKAGAPISEARDLLGPALTSRMVGDDAVSIYPANASLGTAYQVLGTTAAGSGSGTIKLVTLCRCLPTTPSAAPTSSQAGFSRYANPRYGYSVPVPAWMAKTRESDNGDGAEFEGRGATLRVSGSNSPPPRDLARAILSEDDVEVTYEAGDSRRFVLSGVAGQKLVYDIYLSGTGSGLAVQLTYPKTMKAEMDPVIKAVSDGIRPGDMSVSH